MKIVESNSRVKVPLAAVFVKHTNAIVLGTLATLTTFLLFYLMTVFTLSWGTSSFHYSRTGFLIAQMVAICFFGLGIPISAILADKYGRNNVLLAVTACIFLFGLLFSVLFGPGTWPLTMVFLVLGMFLMGLSHGTIGTALAEIFPAPVRYTGASLSFTLAGVLGASPAPALATNLATRYGLGFVGYYISIAAVISFGALLAARRRMREDV
jgi:MFS family permease